MSVAAAARHWENFIEKLAEVLGRVLTDKETEELLRRLPEVKGIFHNALRNASVDNLARLTREAQEKRKFCKHTGTCTNNCVRGFGKVFAGAFVVKYAIGILPYILNGKILKSPRLLIKVAGWDTFRFALCLASIVSTFKGVQCGLRKWRRKEDKLNAFVAGSLAALAILLDEPSRRQVVAMYLSTRSLEFCYTYMMRRGYVPNWYHGDVLLMALTGLQILYACIFATDTLNSSYVNFLFHHSGLEKYMDNSYKQRFAIMEDISHLVTGQRDLVDASKYTILEHHPVIGHEYAHADATKLMHALRHPFTDNCHVGFFHIMMDSLPRTFKMYFPLNASMSVLFHHQQLLKSPQVFFARILTNSMRSAMFLSMYVALSWWLPCYFSNVLGGDKPWVYKTIGFIAGSSVILEQKSRRIELAMYCLPRALESLWNCLVKWGYARNIKNGEVLYFSLMFGCLLTLYQHEPETLNNTYRSILTRVVGVN